MKVIKVFEYTHLDVDNEIFTLDHFKLLVNYNERFGNKFFNVGNNRIYFKNYVGVFQISNLIIEILPKADNNETTNEAAKNKWHNALIYMLGICGYIKIDSISRADLRLQKITLIDLYYKVFIDEVKSIIHSGLTRRYRHKDGNLPYLKGHLVFNKHIAENYLHKEKFYTHHQIYDHNNTYNQIIFKALILLKNINNKTDIHGEICDLLFAFDGIDNIKITDKLFESLLFNRNTQKYKNAITLARMILQNYSPDIKNGENCVIGILFDMNTLFEKVIYKILKMNENKYANTNLKLINQCSRRFWQNKTIRPDIVGDYKLAESKSLQRFIIDTKWKTPYDNMPDDGDLKQMFAYNIHFGAQQSVLLYPKTEDCCTVDSSFIESEAVKHEFNYHSCMTFYIDLFSDEGEININAGDKLIHLLVTNKRLEMNTR